MTPERWDALSAWLTAWLQADAAGREHLRAQLAAEQPDLVAEGESLARTSGALGDFLDTPALVLAARELSQDDPVLAPGATIGPYRVVGFLARGGMGDVYHATDTRLGRDVAVKVLAETRTADPRRLERFRHEARVTASLDHPNVVRVFDVGALDDRTYLVAELLQGETLRARVARGPLPTADVLRIGGEIARGLAAAHAAGLVHRDLKPENVFLTTAGATKLLDFGIAKLAQDDGARDGLSTLTGVVLGTAGYLAPEQIRGGPVDARADLFALGAVLFEMLTGTRAFAREHIVDTLHAILHDPPPDALAERGDVPAALTTLVSRLLEKSPEARPDSVRAVIAALDEVDATAPARPQRVASARPAAGPPSHAGHRFLRPSRRRWLLPAAAGLVLASAAAMWYGRDESSGPSPSTPGMTLAVVPFRSVPAGPDADLLELGLADVFINRLGQLAQLRVLPLSATERLRTHADPVNAAQALGATHVLTGTVQREGGAIRATVQLVSSTEGRTLWSTPVDADASSAFAVQDIIVTRVIEDLAPRLAPAERRRLAQAGTLSSAAFEAYLRGRAYVLWPTLPELLRAVEHLDEAVTLDVTFADAWASRATAYRRMPLFDAEPDAAFSEARRSAMRALDLQPDHAEALAALGTIAFWHEWDYTRAEELLRRAQERQPSSADLNVALAHLLSNIGRHAEALTEVRRARAADPSWPVARSLEGQFLFMARRYDDALARLDEVVELYPRFPAGHVMRIYPLMALGRYADAIRACEKAVELGRALGAPAPHSFPVALRGHALARMGRLTEAEEALESLRQQAARRFVPPHHEALLLHALGRDDEALGRLRAAVEAKDLFVTFLGVDPKWDGLRDKPEFRDVLRRVHLLEVSCGGDCPP
jgi:eukaryotic-like serine/threonine-protein kinase